MKKIWFAQMLRGIACLAVVFFHIPNTRNFHGFSLGLTGVSIFFLISGFVIPFSLQKKSTLNFLISRFLRIYPVFIVSALFTLWVMYIKNSLNLNLTEIFLDLTIFGQWFYEIEPIDMVVWTLFVELNFYILIAFVTKFWDIKQQKTIILTAVFLTLCNFLQMGRLAEYTFQYVVFMLIGICFYNFYCQNWSKSSFIKTTAFLYFLFLIQLKVEDRILVSYSYSTGLAIFALCFIFREKLKYSKILNFFSEISYPLYLNHHVLGYAVRSSLLLIIQDVPHKKILLTLIPVLFCVIVAYIIHLLVEKPVLKLIKNIP